MIPDSVLQTLPGVRCGSQDDGESISGRDVLASDISEGKKLWARVPRGDRESMCEDREFVMMPGVPMEGTTGRAVPRYLLRHERLMQGFKGGSVRSR